MEFRKSTVALPFKHEGLCTCGLPGTGDERYVQHRVQTS